MVGVQPGDTKYTTNKIPENEKQKVGYKEYLKKNSVFPKIQ